MPKGNWQEFVDPSGATTSTRINSIPTPKPNLKVRVQRRKAGKGGKIVTLITGLELTALEMRSLLKKLKANAGTGGTVKASSLELQGDQVALSLEFLKKEGYKPKQSGG